MLRKLFLVLTLLLPLPAMAQSYMIQPGDVLSVEVAEDNQLNRQVLVLPDGRISFPYAGTIRAAGMSIGQLQNTLSSAMASDFAAPPTVYVSVAQLSPDADLRGLIDVFVMGEVMGPGLKEVKAGTTLLQALSQAGGFTKFAATKRVQLRRADPQGGRERVYVFNYRALTRGAALPQSVVLRPGDVILVPERGLFE